eukprot:CAMPEP_0181038320 /NCGR_PEP_ID=MMETSP1070-20121207/9869_1 /TAXON_ID=265543 /ORGANISM="Minutocellus polymorphus, Strain NH13" /LENGTH=1614 /DNA_ID=CAMNT_0023116089 /DNA_START=216 /DNA_END=5060 /DNA_ORIENTATION=+
MDDEEKEARRKRQAKKMTKIIAKAWNLPHAEHFTQVSSAPTGADAAASAEEGPPPLDLTGIGQALDAGAYHLGRHGWEKFAADLGGVYNRFLSQGKHKKSARRNLDEVKTFLAKVDAHLAEVAETSGSGSAGGSAGEPSAKRAAEATAAPASGKKRKPSDAAGSKDASKKKKAVKEDLSSLTVPQREQRALEQLGNYLEEVGGKRKQAADFTCKVTEASTSGKYDTVFYSQAGKRLRSMIAVAKFLNLVEDDKQSAASASSKKSKGGSTSSKAAVKQGVGKPKNKRELESEQKKMKKEMDKLLKAHEKATKVLDDHRNDHKNDRYPVEDEVLLEEEEAEDEAQNGASAVADLRHLANADIDGFPGIPVECTPDLLMCWDFLCTFARPLSLEPISLDDFAAALIDRPIDAAASPPLYLAEAHIALLRLLLGDSSSDEWWWSTLETEETEVEEAGKAAGAEYSKKKREEQLIPVIKCDLAAIFAVEEDSQLTIKWLQALEDVRSKKPNSAGPIKSAVKTAISLTTNSLVKAYLRKATKQMKPNSAGLTKRAVVWLVDRFREGRPDLLGRTMMAQEVAQQSKAVADEAAQYMDQVDEVANAAKLNAVAFEDEDMDQDSDSDDDGGIVSDDDEDEEMEDAAASALVGGDTSDKKGPAKSDHDLQVITCVPPKPAPTIVDLLLPPGKPQPGTDLISPFTWPCLAGATSCRILHRYKKTRNKVDDNLREFRDLPPLSVAERKRREADSVKRILSECFFTERFGEVPVEAAVQQLCSGGGYTDLSPIQKLSVMRVLVEAAYDSQRVFSCVEDNIQSRITASKALDNEMRRAKKLEKEEKAEVEARARERLAEEAKDAFIQKKRREITRENKKTPRFTTEFIEALTDEEIAEFDDETKAEFDALPGPSSFSRSNVNAMVSKIHEEDAFDTDTLIVLTLEEIEAREDEMLAEMIKELAEFGNVNAVYERVDRETTAKIDKLKREINDFKESLLSLPQVRASAMEGLRDAIEDGTIKALKTAVKIAENAWLSGHDEDTDGVWALDLLRDANLELSSAEKRKRVTQAQRDLIAKRNKCFVRTEPIGQDKYRNSFWNLDNDDEGRVWVEAEYALKAVDTLPDDENDDNLVESTDGVKIGAEDEEKDFLSDDLYFVDGARDKFVLFSRQEYHSSGLVASLAKRHWGCEATDKSLRMLMKNLDGRGLRESALKSSLKEIVEAIAVVVTDGGNDDAAEDKGESAKAATQADAKAKDDKAKYRTTGDDEEFSKAMSAARNRQPGVGSGCRIAFDLIEDVSSALSQRVRLRKVEDPVDAPEEAEYVMGTITGWKMTEVVAEIGQENAEPSEENVNGAGLVPGESSTKMAPVWVVDIDNGGEEELSAIQIVEGISRFLMWRTQYDGYSEENFDLQQYRNALGRYCGRAADAPYASTPAFLARHMIKKEQDLYPPLKNRVYENEWGGKSGARNAWVASIKEYGHDIGTLRNGLLTLEETFFNFCGRFDAHVGVAELEPALKDQRTGKEILSNDKLLFEIELETFGQAAKLGLWNSPVSRKVFQQVVLDCKNVGTLALCLDLLCRNAKGFLDANQVKTTTRNQAVASFEQPELMWGNPGRRSAARQQSYSQYFD